MSERELELRDWLAMTTPLSAEELIALTPLIGEWLLSGLTDEEIIRRGFIFVRHKQEAASVLQAFKAVSEAMRSLADAALEASLALASFPTEIPEHCERQAVHGRASVLCEMGEWGLPIPWCKWIAAKVPAPIAIRFSEMIERRS